MRLSIATLTLALFACDNTPTERPVTDTPATELPTGVSTDLPSDVPSVPPTSGDECVEGTAGLAANDPVAAASAYRACIAGDLDSPEARFGLALSELIVFADSPALAALASECGYTGPLGRGFYDGDDSMLGHFETTRLDSTIALDGSFSAEGTVVDSAFLDTASFAHVTLEDGYFRVEISDDVRQNEYLSFEFLAADPYGDGSVSLAPGVQLDLASLSDSSLYLYNDCSGNCDDFGGSAPTGTLVFSEYSSVGNPVAFALDMTAPRFCDAGDCEYRITGNVNAQLDAYEELYERIPLIDTFTDNRCSDLGDCNYVLEPLSMLADVCPSATQTIAHEQLRNLTTDLNRIADHFEAAGTSDTLGFIYPDSGLFFLLDTPRANQTDALGAAAAFRAAAAGIELGTTHNVMSPNATLGSLAGAYTANVQEYDEFLDVTTCESESFWGISEETFATHINANAGTLATGADPAAAATGLREALVLLKASGQAEPARPGVFDFSSTPAFRNGVVSDIDAVIASLDGTDSTLPTAPEWTVTLGEFFADVPTVEDMLAETAATEIITWDDDGCEGYSTVEERVSDWALEDNRGFPITDNAIDFGTTPLIFRESAYDDLLDEDDYLRFFDQGVRDLVDASN